MNLAELIGQYGVQCSKTHELAPTMEFAEEIKRHFTLESEVAALRAEVEATKDRAVKYQVERNTLVVENSKLRQQVEGMREDAERYRWLRANNIIANVRFHFTNGESPYLYVEELDAAIDAARKESSNG